MLSRIPLLASAILLSAAFCTGCEEDKPLRGSADTNKSTTEKKEGSMPDLPTEPTEYTQLLKLANIDRATLPNVEVDVKGKGKFVMELVPSLAPNTCKRISELIKQNYYSNQRFHRIEDWVVQWGDPQSKEDNWQSLPVGSKGTGDIIPFDDNWIRQDRGCLAMARTAAEKNGDSQMYILKRHTPQLTHEYVAFGWVISGMEVVDKLTKGDQIVSMKFTRE